MIFNGIAIWYVLALFFAASATLLVSHILAVKFHRLVVPSNLFWRQAVSHRRHISFLGRFRYLKTLIFLILLAGLFALVLLRPQLISDTACVIIIDCRAGMSAVSDSDGRTGFNIARDKAKQMIKDLPGGVSLTVIAVADCARVLATADDSALDACDSVSSLNMSDYSFSGAMADALAMADIIAESVENCYVQIFTDKPLLNFNEGGYLPVSLKVYYTGSDFSEEHLPIANTPITANVYLSDNVPVPLEMFYKASSSWRIVPKISQADLAVFAGGHNFRNDGLPKVVVADSGIEISGGNRLRFSEYFGDYLSSGVGLITELYAGSGFAIDGSGREIVPLLIAENGLILACISDGSVIVSDSLFAPDANFWKEPACLEIISQLSILPLTDNFILLTDSVNPYQRLTTAEFPESELLNYSEFEGVGINLTTVFFVLVLSGFMIDFILFSRGVNI